MQTVTTKQSVFNDLHVDCDNKAVCIQQPSCGLWQQSSLHSTTFMWTVTTKQSTFNITNLNNNNNNKMTSNSVESLGLYLSLFPWLRSVYRLLKKILRVWEDLSLSLLYSSDPWDRKIANSSTPDLSIITQEGINILFGFCRLVSKEAKFISDMNQ